MVTRYFLGLPFKHKIYEFNDRQQAEFCYSRMAGGRLKLYRYLF
jgi:hypothetical protein